MLLGLIVIVKSRGPAYWLGWFLACGIAPTIGFLYIVPLIKGLPVVDLASMPIRATIGFILNGAWGLGHRRAAGGHRPAERLVAIRDASRPERLQKAPEEIGKRHGSARLAIHIDMDEMPFGGGIVVIAAEQPDLIAHRAVADMGDAKPGGQRLRIGQRLGEAAAILNHQPDDLASLQIEEAAGDQGAVHHRVEIACSRRCC